MKLSEMNKAKYWLTTELKDDDTPTGGTAHVRETLIEFLEEATNVNNRGIDEMDMDRVNAMLKECGIQPIDYKFTEERKDFAVMIGIYVGNLAAQIDLSDCPMNRDYDSLEVIYKCIEIANNHDFEMGYYDEWLIETGVERDNAFKYAEKIVEEMIG